MLLIIMGQSFTRNLSTKLQILIVVQVMTQISDIAYGTHDASGSIFLCTSV